MTEELKLPELPAHIAHIHSDNDLCWDAAVLPRKEWPVNVFSEDQMRAYGLACARWQRELDFVTCLDEMVEIVSVTNETHNQACEHCAAAIKNQPEPKG